MAPNRAPRRKACQGLLPDGTTPCSATFRGWGRYCAAHLEEHARLAGQYKDAAARAERLRRQGELADRQVRALVNVSVADRALERVRAYLGALGEERRTREAYLRRFPAENDERHEQRLADLQEREAACAVLIERLQQRREEIVAAIQQRRGGRESSQADLESAPLLAMARGTQRSQWGWVDWAWRMVLLAILLGAIPLVIALTFLKRLGVSKSASI
ncbi:hypothetical protein LXA43DRAFT_1035627 [Ganoderma leucocontextum]|nr:hypothetical protein LXA43DRAFT_1035627 [Ganoderma leucocontextum]